MSRVVKHPWCAYSGEVRTKRGIAVVRHILPEPTELERELAVRSLSGEAQAQAQWPTHTVDGNGHYLVVPPGIIATIGGTSDLINWSGTSASADVGASYWAASMTGGAFLK